MTKIRTLLVGSHFVPPAKLLLEHLPSGTELTLVPEPENPYDEHAIKVVVNAREVPESQRAELGAKLPGAGCDLEELDAQGEWQLGHIAKEGGKPLVKAGLHEGTLTVEAAMREGAIRARLVFWPNGAAGVEIERDGVGE